MKGNDSTIHGKTKHTQRKIMQLNKHKKDWRPNRAVWTACFC